MQKEVTPREASLRFSNGIAKYVYPLQLGLKIGEMDYKEKEDVYKQVETEVGHSVRFRVFNEADVVPGYDVRVCLPMEVFMEMGNDSAEVYIQDDEPVVVNDFGSSSDVTRKYDLLVETIKAIDAEDPLASVVIYTNSRYLADTFDRDRLKRWEMNNFITSKGKSVRYLKDIRTIKGMMDNHINFSILYSPNRKNS